MSKKLLAFAIRVKEFKEKGKMIIDDSAHIAAEPNRDNSWHWYIFPHHQNKEAASIFHNRLMNLRPRCSENEWTGIEREIDNYT